MKRVTILLSLLLLAALLISCSVIPFNLNTKTITPSDNIITENRDVSGFTAVDMSTLGKVTITQGDSESLEITGSDNLVELVKTTVRNGVLIIELPEKINIRATNSEKLLSFDITLKDLTGLNVSGLGTVEMAALETDALKLDMSGAGTISLDQITASNVEVDLSGLGKIVLGGTANSANLNLSGAGSVEAGDLQCQSVDISISGLGGATVWATDTLTGEISGAGGVDYYGNPQVNTNTSGLGKFEALGDK